MNTKSGWIGSGVRFVWLGSVVFGASVAQADFRPIPGMTMRTNSPACLAKYQEVYSLAGAYFNGVPAISTLKRVDVLLGGLAFDNATASPVVGKHRTQLYSVASSYGSVPTGVVDGSMDLQNSWDRFDVGTFSHVRIKLSDGGLLRLEATHDSCGSSEKAPNLSISYYSTVTRPEIGQLQLSFSFNFGTQYSTGVCGDSSRTISSYLNDTKAMNVANGEPKLIDTRNYSEISYAQIDTLAEREALALSLAQANTTLYNNFYGFNVHIAGCYYSNMDSTLAELPSDSNQEKNRKRNLQTINNFLKQRQCYFEINSLVDRLLSSGVLKSTTFVTACSKAR